MRRYPNYLDRQERIDAVVYPTGRRRPDAGCGGRRAGSLLAATSQLRSTGTTPRSIICVLTDMIPPPTLHAYKRI